MPSRHCRLLRARLTQLVKKTAGSVGKPGIPFACDVMGQASACERVTVSAAEMSSPPPIEVRHSPRYVAVRASADPSGCGQPHEP